MAGENVDVQVTGKSRYEVAANMATQILIAIEGRNWRDVTRKEYLHAVADSYDALGGYKMD